MGICPRGKRVVSGEVGVKGGRGLYVSLPGVKGGGACIESSRARDLRSISDM